MLFYNYVGKDNVPLIWIFKYPISSFIVGLGLIYFWIIPGYHKILQTKNFWWIPLFIIHGITYAIFYTLLLYFIYGAWIGDLTKDWYIDKVLYYLVTDSHNLIKTYSFLLALLFALDYFNKREQDLILKKNLENELTKTKLATLQAKLEPHFLFNTMNSVVALMENFPARLFLLQPIMNMRSRLLT
jgi:hypothetical protein